MSSTPPPERPYDDDPPVASDALTDYNQVPLLRRNGVCSAILLSHVAVMIFGGCIPLVSLLGIFTTLGVIAVCVIVLSGPVYYNKRKKDGTLKTWSGGNKIAAVILLVLFVGGYGALLYYLVGKGAFAGIS